MTAVKKTRKSKPVSRPAFGGRNDEVLKVVFGTDPRLFHVRATRNGDIVVYLKCFCVFGKEIDHEVLPDSMWKEFRKSWEDARYSVSLTKEAFNWFGEAWCVKLRNKEPSHNVAKYKSFQDMMEWFEDDVFLNSPPVGKEEI